MVLLCENNRQKHGVVFLTLPGQQHTIKNPMNWYSMTPEIPATPNFPLIFSPFAYNLTVMEQRKVGRPKKVYATDPWEPLEDKRMEQLAHCLAAGMSQKQAGIEIGMSPRSAQVNGCKAANRPTVKARTEYLKEQANAIAAESVGLTKGEILRKLGEISALAIKTGDLSAANRALELIGKQLGMFVERKVIGVQALIAELTPENLRLAKPDELLRLVESVDSALLSLPESTEESTG